MLHSCLLRAVLYSLAATGSHVHARERGPDGTLMLIQPFSLPPGFCGASARLLGLRRRIGWAPVQEMEDFGELDDVLQGGPVPQLNANQ
jgi:hypothetical protein